MLCVACSGLAGSQGCSGAAVGSYEPSCMAGCNGIALLPGTSPATVVVLDGLQCLCMILTLG